MKMEERETEREREESEKTSNKTNLLENVIHGTVPKKKCALPSTKRSLQRFAGVYWSTRLVGSHVWIRAGNVLAGETGETG
jgi:hypothetical protein